VSPTTSGAASWPLLLPVSKLKASLSCAALAWLICVSGE
jgi:hypothetical protein